MMEPIGVTITPKMMDAGIAALKKMDRNEVHAKQLKAQLLARAEDALTDTLAYFIGWAVTENPDGRIARILRKRGLLEPDFLRECGISWPGTH